ncbi:hypothetical protein YC2023_017517 [Brassica napus]
MITKRGDKRTDCDTAKTNITTPLDDMPNLSRSPSNSLPISKQPIPLSSIYYRLFETIENHHVPNYTIPLYQQISKFSPQTPRNKRKIFLGKCFIQIWLSLIIVTKLRAFDMLFILISLEGLDTIKDQVSDTPEFDKSCLTALSKDLQKRSFKAIKTNGCHQSKSSTNVLKDITNIAHLRKKKRKAPSPTFNSSEQTIQEDDSLVGTDLFGGLIDEDNHQVFDCSSLENTETENEYSDFDDPMDFETDELNELTKKNSDSCSRGDVPKDPKSSYKKDLDENVLRPVEVVVFFCNLVTGTWFSPRSSPWDTF